jgi:hypothetical protein
MQLGPQLIDATKHVNDDHYGALSFIFSLLHSSGRDMLTSDQPVSFAFRADLAFPLGQ